MKKLIALSMSLCILLSTCVALSEAEPAKEISDEVLARIGPYEEEVTIHVALVKDPTLAYAAGDSLDDNAWQRAYKDYLNINVVYDWTATTTQYDQKAALSIMSGDLPDIMRVDKKNFELLLEGDMIADLTDHFSTLLTETAHKYTDEYDLPFRSAMRDGRLYGLPNLSNEPSAGIQIPYIRADWLKALNRDYPTTQREFIDTLVAFAQEDPDGNGKNDTFGLGIKKDLWKEFFSLEGFFNAYHAYPNIWYENDSGELVYGSVQPEMKAALADLQYLYAQGAIDPEFAIKEYAKVSEDLVSDKIGATFSRSYLPTNVTGQQYLRDPEKYKGVWHTFENVSNDDNPVFAQSSSSNPSFYLVVNKNCENPDALAKMYNLWMELMFSDTVTAEMYHKYHVNDDVMPFNYAVTNIQWPYIRPRNEQMEKIFGLTEVEGGFTKEDLSGEAIFVYDNVERFHNGESSHTLYEQHANFCMDPNCEDTARSIQTRMIFMHSGRIIEDMSYGPQTPTQTERESTLEKLQDEIIIQIITGEKSVDEFDGFVKNWHELGGEDISKEMNEWWATQK